MKLWEIHDQIEAILSSTEQTQGILTDDQAKLLDELDEALQVKILNCALYYEGEIAEAAALRQTAEQLSRRAASHEARAEWLRLYIEQRAPQEKSFSVKDVAKGVKVHWAESQRVDTNLPLEGEELLSYVDNEFVRVKTTYSVDKEKARPLLKQGASIRGLQLRTDRKLRITGPVKKES